MKKTLILSIFIILFYSCSDSPIQGCTDPYAVNYNPNAEYDNNTCRFEVDVVFALDGNVANYLNDDDYATEVVYFINEDNISIGSDQYNPITGFPFALPVTPPYCYDEGFVSFTYIWYDANNSNFSYEAIPNGGEFDFIGNVSVFKEDLCVFVPIEFNKKNRKQEEPLQEKKLVKQKI